MSDSIEFFKADSTIPFLSVKSAFQPNDNDLINIAKKTYKVLGRSFTVDYSDDPYSKSVRCIVIVEKAK